MSPCWGIVVAAGSGTRFGGPKHDALLAGEPLWRYARDALLDGGCDDAVVVGDVPGGVAGGSHRHLSVAAGLAAVAASVDIILVHDAARPLASADLVRSVIGRVRRGDVDGAVPAIPVRDAVKRVAGERIAGAVDRSALVVVQTPQAFRAAVLRKAHAAAGGGAADDAELVERIGGSVAIVPGEPTNLKVTYPRDLTVAAALLSALRGSR